MTYKKIYPSESEPIRLLYISQYYPPEVGAGAVRAEAMVRVLSTLGFSVDVLTETPNYPIGKIYPGYHAEWKRIDDAPSGTITRLWVKINQRSSILDQMVFFSSFVWAGFAWRCNLNKGPKSAYKSEVSSKITK